MDNNLSSPSDKKVELIEKILQNPLLLRKLSDRVHQLLLEDRQLQRDRLGF